MLAMRDREYVFVSEFHCLELFTFQYFSTTDGLGKASEVKTEDKRKKKGKNDKMLRQMVVCIL
jgi:hypothetical protein